jgi:Ca2+/H+ antiporter
VKRVVAGLVVVFLIFYIMTSPDAAANIVQSTWNVAVNVAHGVGTFLNKLAS